MANATAKCHGVVVSPAGTAPAAGINFLVLQIGAGPDVGLLIDDEAIGGTDVEVGVFGVVFQKAGTAVQKDVFVELERAAHIRADGRPAAGAPKAHAGLDKIGRASCRESATW